MGEGRGSVGRQLGRKMNLVFMDLVEARVNGEGRTPPVSFFVTAPNSLSSPHPPCAILPPCHGRHGKTAHRSWIPQGVGPASRSLRYTQHAHKQKR